MLGCIEFLIVFSVKLFNALLVYFALVRYKATTELRWYVHKLVDDDLFSLWLSESVVFFGNDLNYVIWLNRESVKPDPAHSMNPSLNSPRFATFAPVKMKAALIDIS